MSGSLSERERPSNPFYGEDLAGHYGADAAPHTVTRAWRQTELAVTELLIENPPGWTPDPPPPDEDAWMVGVQLVDKAAFEYWEDDRSLGLVSLKAGDVTLHDLRRRPTATIDGPLHSLLWLVPQAALNALADEGGVPHIDELRFDPRLGVADATLTHLSIAILPALRTPEQVSRLFADHLALAFAAHVAHTYGGLQAEPRLVRGGLAPWQVRRAKELLAADLSGATSLTEIAAACGLSTSHFARAFRKSAGMAPHAWLLSLRVRQAMALLRQGDQSLSEIALACGFVDQSHFTRVFARSVGVTPGVWRRTLLS